MCRAESDGPVVCDITYFVRVPRRKTNIQLLMRRENPELLEYESVGFDNLGALGSVIVCGFS